MNITRNHIFIDRRLFDEIEGLTLKGLSYVDAKVLCSVIRKKSQRLQVHIDNTIRLITDLSLSGDPLPLFGYGDGWFVVGHDAKKVA